MFVLRDVNKSSEMTMYTFNFSYLLLELFVYSPTS